MDTVSQSARWQSPPLPLEQALNLLFGIRRDPLFEEPIVVQAAPRKWTVQWGPTAARFKQTDAARQSQRLQKALEEGPDYIWVENEEGSGFDVMSLSGQVYTVAPSAGSCDCPDHRLRCRRIAIKCKHILAFELGLGTIVAAGTEGHPRA